MIMNLMDFFMTDEVTTYRDPEEFLDNLSSICTKVSYELCVDALCETMYTDTTKVYIEDFLGDGTEQIVMKTDVPFMTEMFYLKVFNKARGQEKIVPFDVSVCGAEIISNVGNQTELTLLNVENYGEIFAFDLFLMFESTGGENCPITNITYVFTSDIIEIDNSLRFSLGENDTVVQTVPSLEEFYETLFFFSNDTVDVAKI